MLVCIGQVISTPIDSIHKQEIRWTLKAASEKCSICVRKNVQCPCTCAFCDNCLENDFHIFFDCQHAICLWKEAEIWTHIEDKELQVEGTKELVFYLLSSLSSHSSSKFCIIIWSIWNDLEVSPHISISLAMQFLADWQHARAKSNTTPSSTTNQNSVQWHKPPTGQIKCNMDATIFSHDTRFGVGLCLRDETGRIIRAKTSWHPVLPETAEAEAWWTLYQALKWTKEFNISNVIFESDCKNVEDVFNNSSKGNSELYYIIQYL